MPNRQQDLSAAVNAFTARFAAVADHPDGEAARRSMIMQVTLEIAAAEGVKGASLRRIAARTGIRTASLYSYFPGGKEELASTALAAYLQAFYRAAAAALRPDEAPRENVRRLVFAHTRWTLENPRIAPAILVLERAHAMHPIMTADTERSIRELHDTYRDLLHRLLLASGAAAADVPRLAALLIVLCDHVDAWAVPGTVDEAQEAAWLAARGVLGWAVGPAAPAHGDGRRHRQRKAGPSVRA